MPELGFEVVTAFPEIITAVCEAGLIGKAQEKGLVSVHTTSPRAFASGAHKAIDDAPFGGGAGMVMRPNEVMAALEDAEAKRGRCHRIVLTPSAPRFDQAAAVRLAAHDRIALLCGRYEGIDDRVREHFADECLSIGDYVLNGGEVAAAAIIEAVARLRPGVLGNESSATGDSFSGALHGLLEHPHYTRPAEFRGHTVPKVLLSGDHGTIAAWRHERAVERTWAIRPELRPDLRGPHTITIAGARVRTGELDGIPVERTRGWPELRQLRKRLGGAWIVGAGVGPEATPQRTTADPRVALDWLGSLAEPPISTADAVPALILVPSADPLSKRAEVWLTAAHDASAAPDKDEAGIGKGLAKPGELIDISQPAGRARLRAVAASLRTT